MYLFVSLTNNTWDLYPMNHGIYEKKFHINYQKCRALKHQTLALNFQMSLKPQMARMDKESR